MPEEYDIIVVGGGHAGCEAGLASARMGCRTLVLTMNIDAVARMSCNPAIGGLAKGQLVREIDALGGEMAKVADATGIQFKMLNRSRGPAVHSPRCQSDRLLYSSEMRRRLEAQAGLDLREEIVEELIVEKSRSSQVRVRGVKGKSGLEYESEAVILTTGTFLKGLIHLGPQRYPGGRAGEFPADALSDHLRQLGLEIQRFKTGTPPRLNGRTVDYSRMEIQFGDKDPAPFSFSTEKIDRPELPCYVTSTTPDTHRIIRDNLHQAPLYTGQIQGTGPRYCPSIEVKVVNFPDREHHQLFIEPEGLHTSEVYINGLSMSLPPEVQLDIVRSVPGLENAHIERFAYAIEYDFVPPTQTHPSMESKLIDGLFLAGQINGTSGYEEAAAQGLVASINAVLKLRDEAPFTLDRSEGYTGVLIDDLVTRGAPEPYRMFTSRAEYRLLLRQDNADQRLAHYGHKFGLVSDEQFASIEEKSRLIKETRDYIEKTFREGTSLAKMLRRPGASFSDIAKLDEHLRSRGLPDDVKLQVEIETKYEGYIKRQNSDIAKFKRLEKLRIPPDLDYADVPHLSHEGREKLTAIRPESLGQAGRISGVSPADISVLTVFIEAHSSKTRGDAGTF